MDNQTQPLGWTTPEQSKRLVEAGLDPTTNDLWYGEIYFVKDTDGDKLVYEDGPYYMLCTTQPSKLNVSLDAGRDVPCWSFGKLIYIISDNCDDWRLDNIGFAYGPDADERVSNCEFGEGNSCIDYIVDAIIFGLHTGAIKKGE